MENEENFSNKDDLFDKAKDYINTTIELKRLIIIEKSVKAVGAAITSSILVLVAVFFLIFLSIAVGLYLGEMLASTYQGFFLVAAFYFIVAVILVLIRKNYIQNPLVDILIRRIFKKNGNGDK